MRRNCERSAARISPWSVLVRRSFACSLTRSSVELCFKLADSAVDITLSDLDAHRSAGPGQVIDRTEDQAGLAHHLLVASERVFHRFLEKHGVPGQRLFAPQADLVVGESLAFFEQRLDRLEGARPAGEADLFGHLVPRVALEPQFERLAPLRQFGQVPRWVSLVHRAHPSSAEFWHTIRSLANMLVC